MEVCIVLMYLIVYLVGANGQKDPNFVGNRSVMVHLMDWKWLDIAKECENFLSTNGFGAVQISPPNENVVINIPDLGRPWYERYQPVSYRLVTRSGIDEEFKQMTQRCNKVGVRIYADVILNHMSATTGVGTNGSQSEPDSKSYPSVPYESLHFHPTCTLNNYQDPVNVRNCELEGLKDLDQGLEYVRGKLVGHLNQLIDYGVAGFRIDAAKHIWPSDLEVIFSRLKNLNTDYGFPVNSRPFIYQEVSDFGTEAVKREEYTPLGRVCEFRHGVSIGNVFQGNDKLTYLSNWGAGWGFLPNPSDAVVFVDNHDTQRDDDTRILTHKSPKRYMMANAFMLAHPYAIPKIMSSFEWSNKNQGPPQDEEGNIISPGFNDNKTCTNGYVCEHRWSEIYNMVLFRAAVEGTQIENWWSNGEQQIAFCRGTTGFIAFTQGGSIDQTFNVCVPPGTYCDIISGGLVGGKCTGKSVTVSEGGVARIQLNDDEISGAIAIYTNAKL